MNFDLVRPCPKCPFRQDIDGYLRGDRAREIAEVLANGGTFACHQTTVDAPEDDENFGGEMMETADSQMCAGAMRALMQSGGPNQIMRIAERTKTFDPERLDKSVPVGSLTEFIEHHSDDVDEEMECCSVVDAGCEHPAGILMGGTILPSEEKGPTTSCEGCGESVCENCQEDGYCNACVEYREENEDD